MKQPTNRELENAVHSGAASYIKQLRAERDEAVTLLHRMIDAMTSEELNCDDPVDDACTFLSRLDEGAR